MNENHAQFFRELRDLCEKYEARIAVDGDAYLQIEVGRSEYRDGPFDGYSQRFGGVEFEDTPQKDGEE